MHAHLSWYVMFECFAEMLYGCWLTMNVCTNLDMLHCTAVDGHCIVPRLMEPDKGDFELLRWRATALRRHFPNAQFKCTLYEASGWYSGADMYKDLLECAPLMCSRCAFFLFCHLHGFVFCFAFTKQSKT